MPGREDSETGESSRRQLQGLPVIRRNVAGIDLGSERHWVCAPTRDGSGREIASFGATTAELLRLAGWLKARQVESVAMESTGVYWIAPHEVLEAQALQVLLVDTRQLARVPGRDKKTDPSDCEWIQRLHSCGLLRGSFRPEEAVCMLRTLVRDKANLVAESGDWLRRMQKSLDQMNVRVHRAVSDIDGVTGMAMLRAIAARQALYRMSGVDITQIDALGVETVEVVLSEYGPDLSRFPDALWAGQPRSTHLPHQHNGDAYAEPASRPARQLVRDRTRRERRCTRLVQSHVDRKCQQSPRA